MLEVTVQVMGVTARFDDGVEEVRDFLLDRGDAQHAREADDDRDGREHHDQQKQAGANRHIQHGDFLISAPPCLPQVQ